MTKKIDDSVLDELLRGCERPKDLPGDGGLMRGLKKALMERMFGAELTAHPSYLTARTNRRNTNARNA